jgi:hypothetical protein
LKNAVYSFVVEFGQKYDDIINMDIEVFSDICSYLNMKNKGVRKLSQQQREMKEKAKEDNWWKDG